MGAVVEAPYIKGANVLYFAREVGSASRFVDGLTGEVDGAGKPISISTEVCINVILPPFFLFLGVCVDVTQFGQSKVIERTRRR